MVRWASAASVVLLAACSGGDEAPADSENGATWLVDAEPVFTVGQVEGPDEALLTRVTAVHRLPDGGVMIADGGGPSIRIHGPSGALLRAFGREGQGPGEFRSIWGAWVSSPDTVVALDLGVSRLTRFTLEGEVVDTRRIVPGEGTPDLYEGSFSDGGFVIGWGEWGNVPSNSSLLTRTLGRPAKVATRAAHCSSSRIRRRYGTPKALCCTPQTRSERAARIASAPGRFTTPSGSPAGLRIVQSTFPPSPAPALNQMLPSLPRTAAVTGG